MSDKIKILQARLGLKPDGVLGKISFAALKKEWKVNNEQLAHILAQIEHESAGFTSDRENLNYSVKRLIEIFKRRFDRNHDGYLDDLEKKKIIEIAGNPEKIANFVYANIIGNGDENSGDGWKFRGAGGLQTTGKANFYSFSKFIGEDCVKNPELVATKYYFDSAIFYFNEKKLLNKMKIVNDASITSISISVNGAKIGLDKRIDLTYKWYNKITK